MSMCNVIARVIVKHVADQAVLQAIRDELWLKSYGNSLARRIARQITLEVGGVRAMFELDAKEAAENKEIEALGG